MYLVIVFDKMVNVVHSSFSIDGQTLLARLGGSVSSGRTLLWVLLTILGAAQVCTCTHYPIPCGIDTFFPDVATVENHHLFLLSQGYEAALAY